MNIVNGFSQKARHGKHLKFTAPQYLFSDWDGVGNDNLGIVGVVEPFDSGA